MANLLKEIDERSKLAGTNKLELLLFTLGKNQLSGREECFGINVFKVREVLQVPPITRAPDMPRAVEGMVSLRGVLVPVLDIAKYAGIQVEKEPEILIVTEYNGKVQGFLVSAVDKILRLDWSDVKVPPEMLLNNHGGLVTAVTELKNGTLVMLLDVEKVLAETNPQQDESVFSHLPKVVQKNRTIFFVDDSSVARSQVAKTLDAIGVNGIQAVNGQKGWDLLQSIAAAATDEGVPVSEKIQLILTDVEMPEMDGYLLTKKIKSDPRFNGIPVIMHSSLSGESNQVLGRSVGVDEYISKFEPNKLANKLVEILAKNGK